MASLTSLTTVDMFAPALAALAAAIQIIPSPIVMELELITSMGHLLLIKAMACLAELEVPLNLSER